MKQKVAVLGKGPLAISISDWFLKSSQYELLYVVPQIPEPAWTDSLIAWARNHQVPIVESGHFKDIPRIQEDGWMLDLAFSVFYDKIIKDWFIKKCHRILNLHNSPLPKYRGVSPINWALKNGEPEHGATIHEITPGIDDGPIVAQVKYSIYPEFDEVITVYNRALKYGWALFQQTMPILDQIEARPQDHSQASYYHRGQDALLGERRSFTRAESLAR